MVATTPKNFGLRFFYFMFACLLYSIWRAVDLLVQLELTGEYEHSPLITADNTLTLLKKETGIGSSEWLRCWKSRKFVHIVECVTRIAAWRAIWGSTR
jgi:hypothetical protein